MLPQQLTSVNISCPEWVLWHSVTILDCFSRNEEISPMDDLAFDMYVDGEVAQILRKLEQKKRDAINGMTQHLHSSKHILQTAFQR